MPCNNAELSNDFENFTYEKLIEDLKSIQVTLPGPHSEEKRKPFFPELLEFDITSSLQKLSDKRNGPEKTQKARFYPITESSNDFSLPRNVLTDHWKFTRYILGGMFRGLLHSKIEVPIEEYQLCDTSDLTNTILELFPQYRETLAELASLEYSMDASRLILAKAVALEVSLLHFVLKSGSPSPFPMSQDLLFVALEDLFAKKKRLECESKFLASLNSIYPSSCPSRKIYLKALSAIPLIAFEDAFILTDWEESSKTWVQCARRLTSASVLINNEWLSASHTFPDVIEALVHTFLLTLQVMRWQSEVTTETWDSAEPNYSFGQLGGAETTILPATNPGLCLELELVSMLLLFGASNLLSGNVCFAKIVSIFERAEFNSIYPNRLGTEQLEIIVVPLANHSTHELRKLGLPKGDVKIFVHSRRSYLIKDVTDWSTTAETHASIQLETSLSNLLILAELFAEYIASTQTAGLVNDARLLVSSGLAEYCVSRNRSSTTSNLNTLETESRNFRYNLSLETKVVDKQAARNFLMI